VATPNEPELKSLFHDRTFNVTEDYLSAGKELMETLNASGIVLKRGHKGILVFQKDQDPKEIKIHGGSDIVDVTGAGDTVISVVALAVASGSDMYSAAYIANVAAGLVVMKEGAYPVEMEELLHELS
jgi:bifunctional ADP-heptose synthase (sugar kinase/adenylyltransferase)